MRGAVLLVVQSVLVLTTAGKYLWERHERPAVWTQVQLFNEREMRFTARDPLNRYMQAQLLADACSLPARPPEDESDYDLEKENKGIFPHHSVRKDRVRPIAKGGRLVLIEADKEDAHNRQDMYWDLRKPCTEARLPENISFYVPSAVAMPTKLKPGDSVWALVTVPNDGPPRPIELALSNAAGWHPLGQK